MNDFSRTLDSARQADALELLHVADCFENAIGVQKNLRQAFTWYRRAAEFGVVEAMYEVARCYITGAGAPQRADLCRFWLEKAYASDHMLKGVHSPATEWYDKLALLLQTLEEK
jgi:TPR repeat protein